MRACMHLPVLWPTFYPKVDFFMFYSAEGRVCVPALFGQQFDCFASLLLRRRKAPGEIVVAFIFVRGDKPTRPKWKCGAWANHEIHKSDMQNQQFGVSWFVMAREKCNRHACFTVCDKEIAGNKQYNQESCVSRHCSCCVCYCRGICLPNLI